MRINEISNRIQLTKAMIILIFRFTFQQKPQYTSQTQETVKFLFPIISAFKLLDSIILSIIFSQSVSMSKSCHESFECAAKAIRESDKEPSLQKVTKEERMRLYGLYKQATEGDCTTSKPVENVESQERDKCEAWCKRKGMSKEEAEKQYVQMAKDMLNKYGASKLINF